MIVDAPGTCAAPYPVDMTAMATFSGTIERRQLPGGASYSVDEDIMITFRINQADAVTYSVTGSLDASCVGASTTVQPDLLQLVVLPAGASCPTAGKLLVVLEGMAHAITYTASGGVRIDVGADGFPDAIYASCEDPQIEQCFE